MSTSSKSCAVGLSYWHFSCIESSFHRGGRQWGKFNFLPCTCLDLSYCLWTLHIPSSRLKKTFFSSFTTRSLGLNITDPSNALSLATGYAQGKKEISGQEIQRRRKRSLSLSSRWSLEPIAQRIKAIRLGETTRELIDKILYLFSLAQRPMRE